jgi:cytochrome c biogenesis protein CcmG/thiol:disulfide interchange protein DsbE
MTKTTRYGLIGVALALAAVMIAVLNSRFGIDPTQVGSPLVGRQVPEVELVVLGSGESLPLGQIVAANDVTVVNFFASWCVQCRLEHDDLLAVGDTYADRGVQFVGVSFQDREEDSLRFLDALGRSETAIYTSDPGSVAAIEFGVFGIPETFFIRDGHVVGKLIGETSALILTNTLESILAGDHIGSQVVGDQTQQPGQ